MKIINPIISKKHNSYGMWHKYDFLKVAISTDATRWFLTGIYYLPKEHKAVTTDGKRLHIVENIDFPVEIEPTDPVDEKGGIILKVECTKSQIVITGFIDGRFPNYEKVIPETSSFFDINLVCAKDKRGICLSEALHLISSVSDRYMVNYEYLLPLFGHEWRVNYKEDSHAGYVFNSAFGTAVIMPFLLDD